MASHLRLLFILLLSFLLVGNSDLAADKAVLLHLRSSVGGLTRSWTESNRAPCSWDGVLCENTPGRVTEVHLVGKGLSGEIPLNSIGNLTQLRVLRLGRNSLSGSLPWDLGSCTELRDLFLQQNNFSGEIPETLFRLNNLRRLSLAGNKLSGQISTGFNNLKMLRVLNLENNQFTGSIPELKELSELRKFNVSDNRLNGSIPSSLQKFTSDAFLGNSLCGSPLISCLNNGNNLSGGAIAGIVIGSVIGLLLILVILFILWRRYTTGKTQPRVEMSPSPARSSEFEFRGPKPIITRENSGLSNAYSGTARQEAGNVIKNDEMVFVGERVRVFSLEELLRASAEVLGKGTFGTTFRAYLEVGGQVVVKRLKSVCVFEKEFREKLERFGALVHENLVPLRAYYYGREEKILIYDSMPMGSLAALLHGNRGADRTPLTWEVRSSIASGAACGIEFLHSLGHNVSHGNIKSSNILLTDDYTACVSEYGLSQLVLSTHTLNLNGYCAPEVTDSRKVSQKADVYSFGVLVLELLTGKTPTHELSNQEGIDLPRWVQSAVQENRTAHVFDPELLRYQNNEEQMVQLLHLAIYCTSRHPDKRPSMLDVTKQIKEICGSR
ncbi:hypothetical protein F0562_032665 [Nyssa sinensis]|uniref:Protein kinase domain-containing protein n=1 Tax=Nyssa sinensis TaxID=561372 RepID=A0A5J5AQH8_9ASTE|nr:hypothetical protein F0562_032665 [Nyssa sinensis]